MQKFFQNFLWQSRLIVIVAVVASLIVGVAMFYLATVDSVHLTLRALPYADPALTDQARSALRLEALSQFVAVVDGYLLASIMLIFALGLYELFIGKIEVIENSELAARLLLIRSFDDLKDRLAKVILLMLVVKFFQQALQIKYTSPLDLLYLALGTLMIGGALYLSHQKNDAGH